VQISGKRTASDSQKNDMGIDIYTKVEKRVSGQWIPVHCELPEPRNYALFAILAGVGPRGKDFASISPPRGLPQDVSKEIREYVTDWGNEACSISYLTLAELEQYDWHGKHSAGLSYMEYAVDFLETVIPLLEDLAEGNSVSVRMIFWFDNCATTAVLK
jgi:hypothetical protein